MVLNHASVSAPHADRRRATEWLKDMASGMGLLVREEVVQSSLRMERSLYDTPSLSGYSLHDVCLELRAQGYRDEYVFLVRLATKVPLLSEVGQDLEERFRSCEERMLPAGDGEPLVLCAIADWIAIGFPSEPTWDRDRITVRFDELLPDETIGEVSEEIDQLTRSVHAGPICERHRVRHRNRLRAGADPHRLWVNRETIFPNLVFGPDVEDNLRDQAHLLPTIAGKLADLDQSARDWHDSNDPAPPWRTNVSPESNTVMNNRTLRNARVFRTHLGTREIFQWHARFGNSGRIHLRFDPDSREIEIGYIGPHLPL